MPRKNYRRKTGAKRKMPYKKAAAVVSKHKKAQRAKNMDTFSLKCPINLLSIPNQGVTTANYVYHDFLLMNATSSYGVTNASEFILFRNLYDQVRINSITVKVTPKANTLSLAEAQYDATMNMSGDGLVHTVVDRDGSGPWNSTQMAKYSSYKKYNIKRPFTRAYKISYPKGVWLDCQNIYEDTSLLKRLGALGGVSIYSENIPEDNNEVVNEPWAQIELVYNVVFRGKTSAALSEDASGNVTVSSFELGTRPSESVALVTAGTMNNVRLISTDDSTGIITTPENDYSLP